MHLLVEQEDPQEADPREEDHQEVDHQEVMDLVHLHQDGTRDRPPPQLDATITMQILTVPMLGLQQEQTIPTSVFLLDISTMEYQSMDSAEIQLACP